ncbi:MAG: YbaB/EbfC family nucleoid-associated protein [Deltaproteobacteria bacterium]|nr:MAG: YbaB/EbfC family nucleoid-associated protein [Deltaproteobacteria bacterium]
MKGGMQNLMKQAQQMQRKMAEMQKELGNLEVEAAVGGGMVKAVVNGHKRVVSVHIEPDVVDPEDIEMLQDLVVAAVNEGMRLADEKHQEEMSKIVPAGMMGGLGGLGGMF